MVLVLILAERRYGTAWFSVSDDLAPNMPDRYRNAMNGGDYAKLSYWDLLEAGEGERDDGSPRTGQFRVTGLGQSFVNAEAKVQSHALVYNGRLLRLDGDFIGVRKALRKRFNYDDLMGGR